MTRSMLALVAGAVLAGCLGHLDDPQCQDPGIRVPTLGLEGQDGIGQVDVPLHANGSLDDTTLSWTNETGGTSGGQVAKPTPVVGGWSSVNLGSALRKGDLVASTLDCPKRRLGSFGVGPVLSAPPSVDAGDGVHVEYASFDLSGALVATNIADLAESPWSRHADFVASEGPARLYVYASAPQERQASLFGVACLTDISCYETAGSAVNAVLLGMAEGESRVVAAEDGSWPGGAVLYVKVLEVVATPCAEVCPA